MAIHYMQVVVAVDVHELLLVAGVGLELGVGQVTQGHTCHLRAV